MRHERHECIFSQYGKWKIIRRGNALQMPSSIRKGVWKVHHKNWIFLMAKAKSKSYTLTCSCQCSCTVPHSNAISFSIKTILFENTNMLFTKSYWKVKWMLESERKFEIKARLRWTAYVSNYLHLKSFAWKWDWVISSKLKTSRIWSKLF